MNIDISTFVLVLGITHLIQVAVFYQQFKINKTYQGVGWWLLWSIAEIVGFAGMLLRGIPEIQSIAIIFQNVGIFLGVIFIYIGMMRFLDRKENQKIILSVSTLYIIAIVYFVYVDDNAFMRTMIFNASVSGISFLTAYVLFVHKMPSIRKSAHFNAAIFLVHGGVFTYRTVMFLAGAPVDNFFRPTLFNYLPVLDALIVSLSWTYGFIIMLNQRLNADMTEAKEQLQRDIAKRKQAEEALLHSHAKLEKNLKGSIEVISETIERKGPYVPGHHRRVAALASAIAREIRLTDYQVQGIGLVAAVYDIGLIDIPIEFLQDSTRLEGLKLAMYQGYPQAGHDAMMKIEFPWPIADIILQHRECFDGSGFPQGVKGDAILIEARIMAVADAIEDLTSNKINRPGMHIDETLAIIGNHSGTKFDADVVTACLRLFNEKGYRMES